MYGTKTGNKLYVIELFIFFCDIFGCCCTLYSCRFIKSTRSNQPKIIIKVKK